MALTAGAKKFLVMIGVVAVLGGGYYYIKSSGMLDKQIEEVKTPTVDVKPVDKPVEISQHVNSSVSQVERGQETTEGIAPLRPEPANPEPRVVPRNGDTVRKIERSPKSDQQQDKAIKTLKSLNAL